VNLTNVQVPDEVVGSQRDANKAIEDRERFAQEAQAYANDILPRAQGTSQRMLQDAEAYKAQVVSLAEGDVARFNSIAAADRRSPGVTRERLRTEAIEQILRESHKVILDTKSGPGGNMIYLPIDQLLKGAGARTTGTDAQPAAQQALPELPAVTVDGRARGAR
jgi:membrane protease subunit HflK